MNCDAYRDSIDDLVDGALAGPARADLEAHLSACPACTALVEDLLVVSRAARSLPQLGPPEGSWDRISAAVTAMAAPEVVGPSWRQRLAVPLAIAALLLAAIAITLLVRRDRAGVPAAAAVSPSPAPQPAADLGSIEYELRQAEAHYENAIGKLEGLAKDRQSLDPNVAADLQKNLLVIDRAIGESRAALSAHPTSERAQESLFEAFRSKIGLLQDTIALINEMRKGNQAEAGRIAEGLSKP
jgi:Putative zinc-finger